MLKTVHLAFTKVPSMTLGKITNTIMMEGTGEDYGHVTTQKASLKKMVTSWMQTGYSRTLEPTGVC